MQPVVLTAEGGGDGPRLIRASFRPERGMMLSQLTMRLPGRGDVDLVAPGDPAAAADDFAGNASFSFGGAFLAPYANRIRGRALPNREIGLQIAGCEVALPANWSGKAPGSKPYAMHGLILRRTVEIVEQTASEVRGRLRAGDFAGHWPSKTDLTFHMTLTASALSVVVTAINVGDRIAPIGIGWHPYFALPSGDRRQARLHVAARNRLEVADYDAVLPTGRILPLAGTPYDFADPRGRPLGELYLDDCFIALSPRDGVIASVFDPAADFGLQLWAQGPFHAVQVYAPPDKAFVVVEPQFNLADPFSDIWPVGTDTGMTWLQPQDDVRYNVEMRLVAPAT